jgi:hypothetical protein
MMNCREFTDRVTDYLDGRIPYGARIGMWLHAALCVHCRNYLSQMRHTVEWLGEVGEHEHHHGGASSDVREELLERFHARHGE